MLSRLGILVLFVLLGAVLNIGVAVACAIWSPMQTEVEQDRWTPGAEEQAWWNERRPAARSETLDYTYRYRSFGATRTQLHGKIGVTASRPALLLCTRIRTGWPWPGLEGAEWNAMRTAPVRQRMAALPSWVPRRHDRVPWGVAGPGMALNSVLYAVTAWLAALGVRHARRAVRTRRGRCPACGYPRGPSSICSECGHRLGV